MDTPRGFRDARAGGKLYHTGTNDLQKLTLAGPVEKLLSTPAAGWGTRSSFRTAPSRGRPLVRESLFRSPTKFFGAAQPPG